MGPTDALRFWMQIGTLVVVLVIFVLLLRLLLAPLERRLSHIPLLKRAGIIVVAMAVTVLAVLHLARRL